jgi:PAS domain S-box-containing protein
MDREQSITASNIPKNFPKALNYYLNSDFSVQLKAMFIFYLSIVAIISLLIFLVYTGYLQIITPPNNALQLSIILIETALLLIYIGCLFLLINGWYNVSAHLIILATLSCVWIVMVVDVGDALSRLDTFVMILAILAMLPLVISKYRYIIPIYFLLNSIGIVLFVNLFQDDLSLSMPSKFEFLGDVIIALLFMGAVAFNIFRINKTSLEKAGAIIKDKNNAEEALTKSERKYREMTELLPQIVFETDLNGFLTYVNKNGFELFGYSDDDFKNGINIISTIHPNDRETVKENIKRLLNGKKNQGNEYTALRKDGITFPIQIFSSVIKENQQNIGIRGIIIDITQRKKAEEEIKINRDQFQSLVSNIPGTIYRCLNDKDWTMLYLSSEIYKLSGYPVADFIYNKKRTFESIIHPEDTQSMIRSISDAIIDEKPWEYEYRIVNRNGSIRWVFEKGRAIYNSNGQIDYLDGFLLDITDKKLAEKELIESEKKYRTLMENMNETVMLVDYDDRVLFVNKKFTEKLGYLPEEIIGKIGYETLLELKDQQIIKDANQERIKNKTGQYELTFIGKEGQKIDFLISGAPLIDSEGNSIGSIGTMTDITELKSKERELEIYRENLEQLVKERTEELEATNEELTATNDELYNQREELQTTLTELHHAQDQLVESEKMASLGILSAGIAHEINNPLNFIQGGVISIESYINDNIENHLEPMLPMIQGVYTGVERVSKIVTSLNHFSRHNDSVNEWCDIHNIIDNCLIMLQNQLKFKIEIVKNYTNDSYSLLGNEGKLHQAFLNILSNAQQAIADVGVIAITTKKEKNSLIISISDTGIGIKPENLSLIYNPFFTTKDPGKGTGLGLSITYNIIKEHKGKIDYTSVVEKGTTAIVTLPVQIETKELT